MSAARQDAPATSQPPHLLQLPSTALELLFEAYDTALDEGCDLWQFAVEVEDLRAAGLTKTQIRRLIRQGYLDRAEERTKPRSRKRRFEKIVNLGLTVRTCAVLTEQGAAFLRQTHAESTNGESLNGTAVKPTWDSVRRELRVGTVVVKRFRQPAPNQEQILEAFEEDGWPPRIYDPLWPAPEQDGTRRLHSTISNLNRGLEPALIRFTGGGDGQSVSWDYGERLG
jgi:hypothetical protein